MQYDMKEMQKVYREAYEKVKAETDPDYYLAEVGEKYWKSPPQPGEGISWLTQREKSEMDIALEEYKMIAPVDEYGPSVTPNYKGRNLLRPAYDEDGNFYTEKIDYTGYWREGTLLDEVFGGTVVEDLYDAALDTITILIAVLFVITLPIRWLFKEVADTIKYTFKHRKTSRLDNIMSKIFIAEAVALEITVIYTVLSFL